MLSFLYYDQFIDVEKKNPKETEGRFIFYFVSGYAQPHSCMLLSPVTRSGGCSLGAGLWLFTAMASPGADHGL